MTCIQIAFKRYSIAALEMPWEQMALYFIKRSQTVTLRGARTIMLNSWIFSSLPAPIIPLLLNELPFKRFKRITQISEHAALLSWIIIYGMALHLLAPSSGLVNIVVNRLGFEPIPFLIQHTLWQYVCWEFSRVSVEHNHLLSGTNVHQPRAL